MLERTDRLWSDGVHEYSIGLTRRVKLKLTPDRKGKGFDDGDNSESFSVGKAFLAFSYLMKGTKIIKVGV